MDERIHGFINNALDKCTTSWCSLDKTKVLEYYDHEVLDELIDIYEYVTKYDVDWKADSMSTILVKIEKDITEKYPYLNSNSVDTLKNYFSYNWK